MTTARAGRSSPTHTSRRDVAAACIGNAVEWYDFAVFGALAAIVGTVYFPAEDVSTRLVAAFAVYGTAFLARPLGAVYFGRRGDGRGRRWALVISVLVMTVATAAVGLVPGYAAVGIAAPIALVFLRAAQGFGAGGELGVAAVFVIEHAPDGRRGSYAAWHVATLAAGTAAGFAVAAALTWLESNGVLARGWWRAAFLLAVPLGLVGLYLRRRVRETPAFTRLEPPSRAADPVHAVWRDHRPALFTAFALISAGAVAFNIFFVFLPTHVASTSPVTLPAALGVAVAGLLLAGSAALLCGKLTDRVGRRPVVLMATSMLAVLAVPLALSADSGSLLGLAVAELVAGPIIAGVLAMALVAEMFPAHIRATGMSLTVGLAAALLGGTAPVVAQLFIGTTGIVGPGLYVAAVAALGTFELRTWPETAFTPLPETS